MSENKNLKNQLNVALISGIVYFFMGIPETVVDFIRKDGFIPQSAIPTVTTVYFVGLVSAIFFLWGFVVLGQKHENSMLWLSAILLIFSTVFFTGYDMASLHYDAVERGAILILDAIFSGTLSILFGVGLLRLKQEYGAVAQVSGILEIVAGISLVLVLTFLIGLIVLIPATLFEILLIYKASKKLGESTA